LLFILVILFYLIVYFQFFLVCPSTIKSLERDILNRYVWC